MIRSPSEYSCQNTFEYRGKKLDRSVDCFAAHESTGLRIARAESGKPMPRMI
jgi:hypothetical protein